MEPETVVIIEGEKADDVVVPPAVEIIPDTKQEIAEVIHEIKTDEKLDSELIVLLGELKAKVEGLESLLEKVNSHDNRLAEHELAHADIHRRIDEMKPAAIVEPEPESVAELEEVAIEEEIPEEIQAEVIKRNRFFV